VAGAGRGRSSQIRERRGRGAAQGKAPRVDGARCALRMRRGDATVSVRQDTRFVDVQQTRVAKTQGAGFLGRRAAPPRVASIIIIRTDAAAPMPTSPPGNRSRSEVGRTPNSATHNRVPAVGSRRCIAWGQVSGCLPSRQVAQAHGRLVAYSGNENRIGLKGARYESGFTIPY
jgi:hypothetical protein